MKPSIAICYTGQNIVGNPNEADGTLQIGAQTVSFKRGNSKLFPAPQVSSAVAIELCARGDWKCVEAGDQKEVDAAIKTANTPKPAEVSKPSTETKE
jgi:hypothetical protein